MSVMSQTAVDSFMSVRQVAAYLHLNEKKVYSLAHDGKIPATKITGKWMFPRELVDRWILDSSHGGLLTDRLIIAGSDDPLFYRLVSILAQDIGAHALISYTPTGTRLGLALLQSGRADACAIHWGPSSESATRHPALLRQHPNYRQWVLIRAFRREQGLLVQPQLTYLRDEPDQLFAPNYRWVQRQSGAGAQRFLQEMLSHYDINADRLNHSLTAFSEREAAAAIVMGQADVAPGAGSTAAEYGLGFIPFGWESFDLALPRRIWFRQLFQNLINRLKSKQCQALSDSLTGYDLSNTGDLVLGDE